MFFLIYLIIVVIIIDLVDETRGACFGQSSIVPPETNVSQIVLIMSGHILQYIDSFTLNGWSLDVELVNETFSPSWVTLNITNKDDVSIIDESIIKSQRYTTIEDITYLLHPPSKSLIVYNASSHTFSKDINASKTLYPEISTGFCLINNKTHLFIIGGMETNPNFAKYYSTLQIYDIYHQEWSLGENMTSPRLGHGCAYDGYEWIYVYGGWKDIFNYAPLIERYSIMMKTWEIFMDIYDNIIGSDLYKAYSRQCLTTTRYPQHGSICVEYPNIKDNEFNGEISVVNHKEEIAMNTRYKMNNFIGMILYDIHKDRGDENYTTERNYSFLLLFGSDNTENAMYSFVDEVDGSMDCYFK